MTNQVYKGKKTFDKKKPPMKKPTAPLRYQIADTAYAAFKMANNIRKLVNTEIKTYDQANTGIACVNTGIGITINNPGQGDTDLTRDGDSLLNKSIKLRFLFTIVSTNNATIRIIVLKDKQNTTGLTDVLQSTGDSYTPIENYLYDKRLRYVIMSDKTYNITTSDPVVYVEEVYRNLDTHTQFNAGTTTVNTNAYKVLIFSDLGEATAPIVRYKFRHLFIDN